MNNLLAGGALDAADFLARVDLLGDIGFTVLISNYPEYFRLTSYFRRYTSEMIGVAMGVNNLIEIFNEKYYENLPGGILESFGRLFRNSVRLYIYPMRQEAYDRYVASSATGHAGADHSAALGTSFAANVLINAKNIQVSEHLQNLYAHLLENHYLESIVGYDREMLGIFSRDVLQRIKAGDTTWEKMVPEKVAAAIKQHGLFGHTAAPAAVTSAAP
jgi:hypothetical protein